ncbi:MAG: HEAT repeat domain-containing protein [Leptonema sp. (in: bacteria)]
MPEPINIYQSYTVEELEKMLNSQYWVDRSNAIVYIQQKHLEEFTEKIFNLLQKDPSSSVRQISALTLGDFQYKKAIPIILYLIKNPQLNSNEAIDINFLIDAISKFKDFSSIKEILFLLDDEDLTKRLKIVKLLEETSNLFTSNQKMELGKIVLDNAIKNQNSDKARTYAMALGRLNYQPSETYLIQLLKNQKELENTKAAAILALGKIKSKHSIPLLFDFLKQYPSKVSENSYLALKEMKDTSAIDPSFALLEKEKLEIQLLLVDILSEIPHESVKEKAYALFIKKDTRTIVALSLLLGKLKYTKATKEIEEILKNKSIENREILAQSLGWMQDKSAIPTLIEVLQEKEGDGRYGAAWSLGILEAKEALPYLLKTAKSTDQKLSILSVEALGHLKDPKSLEVLEDLLDNKNLQIYAIESITYTPGKESLKLLKKYAQKEGEVSYLAIEGLSKRDEKEVIEILIEILRKTDTEDIKAKLLYKALQRKTKKDYITKNQWLEWYQLDGKNQKETQ